MYFQHFRRELHYLIPQKKGMLFMIATLTPNNATYTLGLDSTPSPWFHILVDSILSRPVLLLLLSKVLYDVNTCVHILGIEPHTHHFTMAGMSQLRHKCSQMLCELRRLKDKGGARKRALWDFWCRNSILWEQAWFHLYLKSDQCPSWLLLIKNYF